MSLFVELKRRNVFKVAIAYVVVSWLILQVSEIAVPALRLPDWVLSATLYFLMVGFLPAIIFAWAFEMTPEGLKKEKDVDRTESITHVTGRKLDFFIIGVLAVAVIYLVIDKIGGPDEIGPGSPASTELAENQKDTELNLTPDGPPAKSIAVLPFTNMSEDAGNEFFADGISEEILNALAHIKELKVAGRTSSFAFKGRNEDLRLIGDTLDVAHILEGSVRKAGNTVRVTAQLIKVEDGYNMWSDTYDRELDNIFAIQDEIAAAILSELKAELMGDEQIASARTDPRAYEKYLQAKQLIYTRRTANLEDARVLLDEAITIDDQFAPAWAERGVLAMLLSEDQYGSIPFPDAQAQGKSYLERALELDGGLADALAGLGLYYGNQPGVDNKLKELEYLQRALEINPNLVNASNWLYASLFRQYQVHESLKVLEELFERDPLYPPLLGNLDLGYLRVGRSEDFGRALERIRPFKGDDPRFISADASNLAWKGQFAEALPLAQLAYDKAPSLSWVGSTLRRVLLFMGEHERVAEMDLPNPWTRVRSLHLLERDEEAMVIARKWFSRTGLTTPLIESMSNAGQYQAIVSFIEETWESAEQFQRETGANSGFGEYDMAHIALAYRELGRMEDFERALGLLRQENDRQAAAGISWGMFYLTEAQYWVLANDQQKAIDYLEQMDEKGMVIVPRISGLFPILKPLEGDPRYEAIQQRMLDHVNGERVKAGLEMLEPAYTL